MGLIRPHRKLLLQLRKPKWVRQEWRHSDGFGSPNSSEFTGQVRTDRASRLSFRSGTLSVAEPKTSLCRPGSVIADYSWDAQLRPGDSIATILTIPCDTPSPLWHAVSLTGALLPVSRAKKPFTGNFSPLSPDGKTAVGPFHELEF